jgi:hypothetical protein
VSVEAVEIGRTIPLVPRMERPPTMPRRALRSVSPALAVRNADGHVK